MTEEEIRQALDEISKEENGHKALEILNIISYFAPEQNIHAGMLLSSIVNEEELEAAIRLLKRYSVIGLGQERTTLIANRLVQKVIRKNLQEQKKDEAVLRKAVGIFVEELENIHSSNAEHAMSVWSCASKYQELIKESNGMPNLIVNALKACMNKYEEATTFGLKELDLLKRTIGEDHFATLNLQHSIGALLGIQGKYKESLEILLPLYEKDNELSGKKEVLDTLVLIARQLCDLSRYDEALTLYRDLLGGRQVSEATDRTILTAWHDYAVLSSDLGKDYEALELLGPVLIRSSEILGVDNDDTLVVKNSIAHIFMKQTKYREALKLFEEVFDKRMVGLGENHMDTMRAKNCIALVFLSTGKYKEALKIYEELARKFEQVLGKEHPDTLATRANLGSTLEGMGEYEKAIEVYKDVCKKQIETLGQEHNETLRVKRNIAQLLLKQGKYDEALRTFEQVLHGYNEVFGPEHPDTVAIENLLKSFSYLSSITHSVSKEGDLAKLRSLIDNGANINKRDTDENTPLHYAAQSGHINIIKLLLESGAIYNSKNKDSKVPLQLTEDSKIRNLLESVTNLFTAVKVGNYLKVAGIIEKEKSIINAKEDGGSSSLHWAVHNGHGSIVRLLLENGADAFQVTNKGNTPLHIAASKNNKKMVEILLKYVPQGKLKNLVDAKTTGGNTALHVTVKNGSLDVLKTLLKNGATYCFTNEEGKIPRDVSKDRNISNLLELTDELFKHAVNGNIAGIDKLRSVKSDELIALTNTRNSQGSTLLQVAITNEHKSFANELLGMLRKPTDQTLQDVSVESQFKGLKL